MKLKEHIDKFDESFDESLTESLKTPVDLFSGVEQLQREIQDKDKIIENLKNDSTELKNQISDGEKEKFAILEELKKSGWLENKVTLSSKYKGKLKTILGEIKVVDTKIISMLTSIGRKKQGSQKLNWDGWLKIPENRYLYTINENIAKGVFGETNTLIEIRNEEVRGSGYENPIKYALTFAGSSATDYVSTTFNPDNYDGTGTGLNYGFTVSYWVKPAEIGGFLRALGRRPETDGRFEFGIKSASLVNVGVGAAGKDGNTHNDGVVGGHGMTIGNWYNWVVTYGGDDHTDIGGDRHVRIWINGKEIYKDGADSGTGNENGMGTANWQPSWTNTVNGASNIFFGARTDFNGLDNDPPSPYSQGWACSLSEIAIYKDEKDEDGTFANEVYNAGWGYDHRNNSNLVGYWRLNEGKGTRVEDLSGNGNHGTLTTEGTGIPTWTKNGSYE